MKVLSLLTTAVVVAAHYIHPPSQQILGAQPQTQLALWIDLQANTSLRLLLENIGGFSSSLDGVDHGAVVASPSRSHPNYFFQWTRDSALTMRTLVVLYNEGHHQYQDVIDAYIEESAKLQREPNPLGNFTDPTKISLGEPKFHVNGSAFTDVWGRPQSDGPALRISTLALYLESLAESRAHDIYISVVKHDLVYVVNHWNTNLFDLWEEVQGAHFFNALAHLRALHDGLVLTSKYDVGYFAEVQAAYNDVKQFVQDAGFDEARPYIVETPQLLDSGARSGLDIATLLACIHSHDDTNAYDDIPFDVNDNHVLNSFAGLVTDMKYRFPVNHNKIGRNSGVGLGRYPEDVYDGYGTSEGNPWFISTSTAAELLYRYVLRSLTRKESIVVNSSNRDFFGLFLDLDSDAIIEHGLDSYNLLVRRLFEYADSFLGVVQEHVDQRNGHLSEQFNRYHGYMQGAERLTWSFSSFINAAHARRHTSDLLAGM